MLRARRSGPFPEPDRDIYPRSHLPIASTRGQLFQPDREALLSLVSSSARANLQLSLGVCSLATRQGRSTLSAMLVKHDPGIVHHVGHALYPGAAHPPSPVDALVSDGFQCMPSCLDNFWYPMSRSGRVLIQFVDT